MRSGYVCLPSYRWEDEPDDDGFECFGIGFLDGDPVVELCHCQRDVTLEDLEDLWNKQAVRAA